MRTALLLLAMLALVTAPTVAADDGGEEDEDCVWTLSYYCVDPVGTVASVYEDLKDGGPCTCDPMPEPW